MSNGSNMGEGILFGGRLGNAIRSLTPKTFGVDCGRGFCLHRQNLSRYFKNLRNYNDFEAIHRCHFVDPSAAGRL